MEEKSNSQKDEKVYLNFEEIANEARLFYKDSNNLTNFETKQKNLFFRDRVMTLEKYLELILNTDFQGLADTQVHYSLFGPFYELLIKLCLLKHNWKKYSSDYFSDKNKQKFEYAKNYLINSLKEKKVDTKKIKRIQETLNFIQIQRNNFLHNPFKGYDHYAVQTQLFELIFILNNFYNLKINHDLLFEIGNRIFSYKRNSSGTDFEDIFDEQINEIYGELNLREESLSELIGKRYNNITTYKFEHDSGEYYPKELQPPEIEFIPPPEPHVIITDLYEDPKGWYDMHNLIEYFAEQSFLSYMNGYYVASMSCSINCCEYILKYEYLRRVNREDAEEFIKSATLGSFTGQNENNLSKIKIKIKFKKKIKTLNTIRRALYHYNPSEVEKLKKIGETPIEKIANPILSELSVPITAYKAYEIMRSLLAHFYNKKNRKKFIKEGLKDAKMKMEVMSQKINDFQIEDLPKVPKKLTDAYLEKKYEFIKNKLKEED